MDIKFESVWSRVTGEAAVTERQTLEGFIAGELADEARYSQLAACTGSPAAKRLFSQHATEEREHSRKLQAAYYLQTGDSYCPPGENAVMGAGALLQALRERYRAEIEGAAAYAAAASAAGTPALRSLYTTLGQDETRHAAQLWTLVERLL